MDREAEIANEVSTVSITICKVMHKKYNKKWIYLD